MRTIYLALLSLAPGIVLAQTAAPLLTVDDAVALALKQNPRLVAAAGDVAAARAGVRSARALSNPSLTFTPAITPGGSDEELLLQQPLELTGTRSSRTGVAQAQLRQTQAQAVVELRELVFDTRRAYYELARARELRAVAQDALRVAGEIDQATRRQAEEGLRPGIDGVQTGIEVARTRQQLTRADSQVTLAQAALNTLMGRAPADPLGELPPLPTTLEPLAHEPAIRQAQAARAEVGVSEALREQFRQEGRLARSQGRPDLVPQIRTGSLTRGGGSTGVGIGITLPLFDYGSRRNRVRQAEESARAQEARLAATRNQIGQEVQQAATRVRAAEAVIRDFQGGVLDQTRRLVEASRTGFQAGLTTVVQLLEAQRTYRAVFADYTNALADYAEARAELERATGAFPATLLPAAGSATRSDSGRPR